MGIVKPNLTELQFLAVEFFFVHLQDFTFEFSRDRKSMSVYCIPKDGLREMFPSSGPKMFVKVLYRFMLRSMNSITSTVQIYLSLVCPSGT